MAYTEQDVERAKAYRQYLTANDVASFGNADRMVQKRFPNVPLDLVREKKHGGLSKVVGGVGDVAKKAAPLLALTGIGAIPAAAITAGANIAGKLNDPGGLKSTKLLKDVIAPAAMTYAGGKMMQGIGGAGAPAPTGPTTGTLNGLKTITSLGTDLAKPVLTNAAVPAAVTNMGLKGAMSGVGKFLSNPNALKAAEVGLGAYGAFQEGKAMDRQQDFYENQYEDEMAERNRRRGVARAILAERGAV